MSPLSKSKGIYYSITEFFKKRGLPYLLVAPMTVMVILVIILPIFRNFWMSFLDWYLPRPNDHPFVWFKNYTILFNDPVFIKSTIVTIFYVVITVIARFILGLGIAVLFNQPFAGRSVARAAIVIPWAIPEVIACLIWIQMFDYQYGIINHWLISLKLINEPLKWLSSTSLALPSAMIVNIWKGTPWAAIMLLAALQSVPNELYEVAMIDGANAWKKFWNVTVPMIKPISLSVFLLLVIWTIRDFAIVYVLNKGGPSNATEVLTIFIYHKAFSGMRLGLASAAGVLLLVVSMLFTVFYLKVMEKEK